MEPNNLRQPNRFAHEILTKKQEQIQDEKEKEDSNYPDKTKKILKKNKGDKKVIRKKFEPSAIRLRAINETFHKLEQKTEEMISEFKFNKDLMKQFIQYKDKVKCKCGRNIRFYCLKCMTKNEQLHFPKVQIPFNTTILHHSSQKINKSSIIPMTFLCNNLKVQTFLGKNHKSEKQEKNKKEKLQQPKSQTLQLPFSLDKQTLAKTYVLFPHKNSQKLTKQMSQNIQNLVILDCTWFQTDSIIQELEEKGIKNYIRLQNYESLFWRYNHHSEKALSSAQSLVYLLREYQQQLGKNINQYDQIMFLYCLQLQIINDSCSQEPDEKREQVVQNQ